MAIPLGEASLSVPFLSSVGEFQLFWGHIHCIDSVRKCRWRMLLRGRDGWKTDEPSNTIRMHDVRALV